MKSQRLLIGLYLAAIVAANLTVTWFGPSVAIVNAFLFIGLDLACGVRRDLSLRRTLMDDDLDRGWPTYGTLGSVPPSDIAKISLFRLLFQRYEVAPAEVAAIQAELAADRLDGRRTPTSIAGIIEWLRGGEYLIPIGATPQLIENWCCHYIRPGAECAGRHELARWLAEARREAERRQGVTG